MTRLTGNRRYRQIFNPGFSESGHRGKDFLVLQVEVYDWNGTGWKCHWRDATEDDIKPESIV